jgi:cytochrome c peroxidase
MSRSLATAVSFALIVTHTLPAWCEEPAALTSSKPRQITRKEPLQPLPPLPALDPQRVALGEKLFHDPLLSRDNTVSCATCHNLTTGGADGKARSTGINSAEGEVNSPSVFNSALNFKQFWDGRANTLEDQANGPLENPKEMGTSWTDVVEKLKKSSPYTSAFNAAYPDGITANNARDAIVTFERSLSTPHARLDKFLGGDQAALTAEEQEGYRLFKSYGCIQCHQGVGVGGNMFQTFGVMGDYFADRGNIKPADLGRYNVTKNEQDKFVFKVPSLRNVALTAPYFHDGSAKTLEEAVQIMAQYQLGRELTQRDVKLLVQFLHTLTGEYQGKSLDTHQGTLASKGKP